MRQRQRTAHLAPSHVSTSCDPDAKVSSQSVSFQHSSFPWPSSPYSPTPRYTLTAPFQISCHKCSVAFSLSLTLCSPLMVPLPGTWLLFTPSCIHLGAFDVRMHKGQRVCGICLSEHRSLPLVPWCRDLFLPCKLHNMLVGKWGRTSWYRHYGK